LRNLIKTILFLIIFLTFETKPSGIVAGSVLMKIAEINRQDKILDSPPDETIFT